MLTKDDLKIALNIKLPDTMMSQYNSVTIDSRNVQKGDIFIGIKGPSYDGSTFAKEAIKNGAEFCIVSRSMYHNNLEEKFIVVEDTYVDGLIKLAKYNRDIKYKNSNFIGITGSVGKTTTKEMTKIVFEKYTNHSYANDGNKNNLYGLPLSIANINKDNLECGIFELGMSTSGEILFLSQILKPHIGVITGIAMAHMESFSSLNAIATAKSEILDGIQDNGSLVVNLDSPSIKTILKIAKNYNNIKIFGYSTFDYNFDIYCKVTLIKCQIIKNCDGSLNTMVTLKYSLENSLCGEFSYKIGCIGDEFIMNSMAVFGTLLSYSTNGVLDFNKISEAMNTLERFNGLKARGQITNYKNFGLILLDDSYNANPTSMSTALKRLNKYSQHSEYNRKIAILGDMLELGKNELTIHRNLIEHIKQNNIDKVFCVGNRMHELFKVLRDTVKGLWFETSDEMSKHIIDNIQKFDLVMVKGSLGMQMAKICSAIHEHCK